MRADGGAGLAIWIGRVVPPPGAPSRIVSLVAGFSRNVASLRDPDSNEAHIRLEYLDEFWTLLGWDVANREQRSPSAREVLVEPIVATIDGNVIRNRRPDYIFRMDGLPRFVVEAKASTIDLQSDYEAIFQAKTYAWNGQIPFAILTNFATMRVFDSTLRPIYDEPERGVLRDFELAFTDYEAQWDVLLAVFGRESVGEGSLDTLLRRAKRLRTGRRLRTVDRMLIELRGSEPVDRAFLALLEGFRKRLAEEIYSANRPLFPQADTRHGAADLTEAVQRLLDRIVFIRVCEDRGVVPWGLLRDTLERVSSEGTELYASLVGVFREFDRLFNGYLFKAHPLSERLAISSELLSELIRSLYMPEGPYRFDAIGDDLLGIIYERFLGSAIVISGGAARIEAKPEVRHAGGVYYTPRFVVKAIVRQSVGKALEQKDLGAVMSLKVLDPACGSGSFLVSAFESLVDHCETKIAENPALASPRPKGPPIARLSPAGDWRLTAEFKAQLLTSCIHGVDIDRQASEVTVMSLYLKLLEGTALRGTARPSRGELLPPLDNNIRCGNSLIDPERFDRWWEARYGGLLPGDPELRFRLNMFDWSSPTHGFGRIMTEYGGFNCIIGNPPYVRVQELRRWAPEEADFYRANFSSASRGGADIYVVFVEQSLSLLQDTGTLAFIMPHKFWQSEYGTELRRLLAERTRLRMIIDFTDQQVFPEANTYTAIHIIDRPRSDHPIDFARVRSLSDGDVQCREIDQGLESPGVGRFLAAQPPATGQWHFHPAAIAEFLESIEARGVPLYPDVAEEIFQGVITGADPVFLSKAWEAHPSNPQRVMFTSESSGRPIEIESDILVPVLRREGFGPYVAKRHEQLLLPYDRTTGALLGTEELRARFPLAWHYLVGNKSQLESREDGRFEDTWWCLSRAQNLDRWAGQKIMVPYMVDRLQALYDDSGKFFVNVTTGGYGLQLRTGPIMDWPLLVVGLLNSRLLDYWLRCKSSHFQGGYYPANKQFIQRMPIWRPQTSQEQALAEGIIANVRWLIDAIERLSDESIADGARSRLEREVESRQRRIDADTMIAYGVEELPAS